MTQAATILQMIETVTPDETAKLGEIDARVWCWLNGITLIKPMVHKIKDESRVCAYRTSIGDISTWLTPAHPEGKIWSFRNRVKYTRSRDALKAIRPQGWRFWTGEMRDPRGKYAAEAYHDKMMGLVITADELPTEELAELYVIIAAIEYDRNAK